MKIIKFTILAFLSGCSAGLLNAQITVVTTTGAAILKPVMALTTDGRNGKQECICIH